MTNPTAPSEWQPIETAPKDGTRFLAYGTLFFDELDEDDRIIRSGVIERDIYVAYGCPPFDGFVSFPWRGSVPGKPSNLTFTHWRPLPEPPK